MSLPCRLATLLLGLALCIPAASRAESAPWPAELSQGSPNQPIASLDLERYAGLWHEVARLPMFFQRRCASDTTATYTLLEDGKVGVRNACRRADGSRIAVRGVARRTEREGALEVQFAPRWLPFGWADYWVIDLDPDYRWAVVGGPSREALWILSRDPAIDAGLLQRLIQRAQARGYDTAALIIPGQSDGLRR